MSNPAGLADDARARFRGLVEPHRSEIQAHCYRMLGSLADAEDAAQEAMLRAWNGVDGLDDPRAARAWLYRIGTNVCLDRLARKAPAVAGEPASVDPCPDALWEATDPGPEARISARESVGMAFLVALHDLPPLQRAVLLLRDVMGWSAAEVGELLDQSEVSVNSALQRARARLATPRRSPPRPPDSAATRDLLSRYVQAWEARDALTLTALLRDDATLDMPPGRHFVGRDAIRGLLTRVFADLPELRVIPVSVSGGVGLAAYTRDPVDGVFRAHVIQGLEVGEDGILALHTYLDVSLFPRFGLPDTLP